MQFESCHLRCDYTRMRFHIAWRGYARVAAMQQMQRLQRKRQPCGWRFAFVVGSTHTASTVALELSGRACT